MLGVGPEPWHRRSWLCRRTRVLTRGRGVAVTSPTRSRRIAARTRLVPSRVALSALSVALGFEASLAESLESSSLAILISLLSPSASLPFWRCCQHRCRHCCWRRRCGGRRHRPGRRPSSMWTPPRQLPCIGPPSLCACASRRRPPPRALMGVVVGFVVKRKRRHCPWRRSLSTQTLPLLHCPCVGPPS